MLPFFKHSDRLAFQVLWRAFFVGKRVQQIYKLEKSMRHIWGGQPGWWCLTAFLRRSCHSKPWSRQFKKPTHLKHSEMLAPLLSYHPVYWWHGCISSLSCNIKLKGRWLWATLPEAVGIRQEGSRQEAKEGPVSVVEDRDTEKSEANRGRKANIQKSQEESEQVTLKIFAKPHHGGGQAGAMWQLTEDTPHRSYEDENIIEEWVRKTVQFSFL